LLKSKTNNRVILALDVTDVDRAMEIASITSEYVDAIKHESLAHPKVAAFA